jgi:ribosomal protein S12 methylthiotransferase accessory factor
LGAVPFVAGASGARVSDAAASSPIRSSRATASAYRRAFAGRAPKPAPLSATELVPVGAIPTVVNAGLEADLRTVVAGITAVSGRVPLAADHTDPQIGIPVVRVVCPGLLCDPVLM